MNRVTFIEHCGKQVLLLDYSYLSDEQQMLEMVEDRKDLVSKQKPGSVLTLADLTGANVGRQALQAIKEANALERPEEAHQYYEQALVIFREVRDRAEEGTTLASLGAIASELGQPKAAREYFEQALVIHREVGNKAEEGATLYNLGTMVYGLEHPDAARRYIEQALVIFEAIGAEGNAQVAGAMLAMLRYA